MTPWLRLLIVLAALWLVALSARAIGRRTSHLLIKRQCERVYEACYLGSAFVALVAVIVWVFRLANVFPARP